jgi:hypothetical protein
MRHLAIEDLGGTPRRLAVRLPVFPQIHVR